MSDTAIQFILQFRVRPGQLDAFVELARELSARTEAMEPRTECYEWFQDIGGGDPNVIWISERYADSAALVSHLQNHTTQLQRIPKLAEITECVVFGSASQELKQALAPLGVKFFEKFSGFHR